MPRAFEYLFSWINELQSIEGDDEVEFLIKGSYLEIYNEQIIDLLDPDSYNL